MPSDDWEVIDTIENAGGVLAEITKKKTGVPRYAIAVFKFYATGLNKSERRKTIYIDAEKVSAARQVLADAEQRLHDLIRADTATAVAVNAKTGRRV